MGGDRNRREEQGRGTGDENKTVERGAKRVREHEEGGGRREQERGKKLGLEVKIQVGIIVSRMMLGMSTASLSFN